jgi:hypothetical protein
VIRETTASLRRTRLAVKRTLARRQDRASCSAKREKIVKATGPVLKRWAVAWPERSWAVESAGGLGHLLAQQLVAAGEKVLDAQPNLAARVRLLAAGAVNKKDPNDARSVADAALRSLGHIEGRPVLRAAARLPAGRRSRRPS